MGVVIVEIHGQTGYLVGPSVGVRIEAPLKPLGTIVVRGAGFSAGCTPDSSRFLLTENLYTKRNINQYGALD